MRLLRGVLVVLVTTLSVAGFLNTGTAAAGQLGYTTTVLSHRCDVVFTGTSTPLNYYQGVHCANLLAVRTSSTAVEVWAQGEAFCQYSVPTSGIPYTVTWCDGIRQTIGLYTAGPTAIRGPVPVQCGDYGGSSCPVARYVHSISHYQITSGCLTNVWSSMTNDALKRGSLSGTGNVASGHFEICANGSYSALA